MATTMVPEVRDRGTGTNVPTGSMRAVPGGGDRTFMGLHRTSAIVVLLVFTAIGLFLAIQAFYAMRVAKLKFLTTQAWQPDIHHFGIAGIMTDTLLIALVAVVIAVPISLGLSLFISEIAPQRIKRTLVSLVDLMAAVPSVVYGLWASTSSRAAPSASPAGCRCGSGGSRSSTCNGSGATNPTDLGPRVHRLHLRGRHRRLAHGHPHPHLGHA